MNANEILREMHRIREEHAGECGYDVDVMFARMKEHLERLKAEGWNVVYPLPRETEPLALGKEPPKP